MLDQVVVQRRTSLSRSVKPTSFGSRHLLPRRARCAVRCGRSVLAFRCVVLLQHMQGRCASKAHDTRGPAPVWLICFERNRKIEKGALKKMASKLFIRCRIRRCKASHITPQPSTTQADSTSGCSFCRSCDPKPRTVRRQTPPNLLFGWLLTLFIPSCRSHLISWKLIPRTRRCLLKAEDIPIALGGDGTFHRHILYL